MNDSDKEFLSRFSLDPALESSFEDLYGFDVSYEFTYDDEMDTFDDVNIRDAEDTIPRDDFLFKN